MRKAARGLCALLRGMFFVGFSVQIVLGMAWMCSNFTKSQQFGHPEGFLYPLFLDVLGRVPQVLYFLQLGLACFAGYELLRPALPAGKFRRVWYVLAFVTVPSAMQCHLALLPCSFVASLLVLEFVCLRSALGGKREGCLWALAGAGGCWAGLAMLLPEYGWLGLPLPALAFLVQLPRLAGSPRRLVNGILLLAACGGIVAGSLHLANTEGKADRTFWFSMASRMAWPTIWQDYGQWPEELRKQIPAETVWETGYAPGNMEQILQPAIEAAVGKEKAQEYYRTIAEIAFRQRKSRIVRQIGGDALVYAAPLAVLQKQLQGVGYNTCSGRNYEIMGIEHPVLTKYYMGYGCWWFLAALAGAVLFLAALKLAGARLLDRKALALWAGYLVSAGVILVFYVMRGSGMADYKRTLAVAAVWTAVALFCMGEHRDCEGEAISLEIS